MRIRRQVEDYIRQARHSIWDLRSPFLESNGDLAQALREAGVRAIAGAPVQLDVTVIGTPRPSSPNVEEQLLFIGQEALSNAVRHGRAHRVVVELGYLDQEMQLRVHDDGCGFAANTVTGTTGHYGLLTMRERAEQVYGRLTVTSLPGAGTEVKVILPC